MRSAKTSASPADRKTLQRFLAAPSRRGRCLSYHELQGFILALAAGPDLVMPSEWMPVVFGDEGAQYADMAEANRIMAALMALYNDITRSVREDRAALPDDCQWRTDLLANLEPDAPVSQWSRGLLKGHAWLKESWDLLPSEAEAELDMLFGALTFFASTRIACDYARDAKKQLVKLAPVMREVHPDAIREYCQLGRELEAAIRVAERALDNSD